MTDRVFDWDPLVVGPRAEAAGIDTATGERLTISYPAQMTLQELDAQLKRWSQPDVFPEPSTILLADE